jgi:hypothetical protein
VYEVVYNQVFLFNFFETLKFEFFLWFKKQAPLSPSTKTTLSDVSVLPAPDDDMGLNKNLAQPRRLV